MGREREREGGIGRDGGRDGGKEGGREEERERDCLREAARQGDKPNCCHILAPCSFSGAFTTATNHNTSRYNIQNYVSITDYMSVWSLTSQTVATDRLSQ